MMYPTIHLNGTSKEELLDQLCIAMRALRDAERKLANSCPNGRDYYPQGTNAINLALDEHANRMARLKSVVKELEDIANHIAG